MRLKVSEVQVDKEFKKLLPPLSMDEKKDLEESILQHGIRVPLTVWKSGKNKILIDGHHRLACAKRHGLNVPVEFLKFENRFAVRLWMWESQRGRRNWSKFTKIECLIRAIGDDLSRLGEKNEKSGKPLAKNQPRVDANKILAEKAGVSRATVTKVKFILNDMQFAPISQLRSGDLSIERGYKAVRDQRRDIDRSKSRTERLKRMEEEAHLSDFADQVINLDLNAMSKKISDSSLDLIITDPPYDRDSIPLYGDLARIAAKKLKPGAFLLCMVGHRFLPLILETMRTRIRWHWMISVIHERAEGGPAANYPQFGVRSRWKPVLVFTKGARDRDLPYFDDVITGGNKDKEWHPHGQPVLEFEKMLLKFSRPEDLVWEPFCGGGVVPVACLQNQRRFIASDRDPMAVETTRQRLMEHALANRDGIMADEDCKVVAIS